MKYLIRGYFVFKVNGRMFLKYSSANNAYESIQGSAYLYAWHIWKGWHAIKIRFIPSLGNQEGS
jgi:hypothetical protein